MIMKTLLKAKNVSKSINGTQILNQINVEIFDNDFTVIMGPSGAGKSTLLYALSGMDTISSGEVFYKEQSLFTLNENQIAKLRAKDFGFVFQQTHLVSNLSIFENVCVAGFVANELSQGQVQKRASELLEKMNVTNAKNRLPSQVSGGEAQRAAIARAIISNPSIVFADEPTGALNKSNSIEVLNLLTNLNNDGQSILMVTHDTKAALRASRILYLEDGKIISEIKLSKYENSISEEQLEEREEKISSWLKNLQW